MRGGLTRSVADGATKQFGEQAELIATAKLRDVRPSMRAARFQSSMNWSKIALFGSGLFFGGAVDHAILAAMGRGITPYGFNAGVVGNRAPGGLDIALAAILFWLHRRSELRAIHGRRRRRALPA